MCLSVSCAIRGRFADRLKKEVQAERWIAWVPGISLLETNVGVSTDGEALFLAMQPILQSPNLGGGLADLARRPYLQVEARDFSIGVFAGRI